MEPKKVRGRFAPSPTGLMHVGNARTALVAWLSVRSKTVHSKNGTFVWRLEDLDTPRVVPGMAEAAVEDLSWLGIDWDEGPEKGGAFGPYEQSARFDIYDDALRSLLSQERIFPCSYSRKDLQTLATAPHGTEGQSPYPVALRPETLDAGWFDALHASNSPYASIRFKVEPSIVHFTDWLQGEQSQNVLLEVGDYVVKRRDGMYAYQLAVVVDDIAMDVTEIVRGMDLISSTARQIQLIEALGGEVPAYAHVPLVLNERGEKLSKRDEGLTLRSLREAGVHPDQLVGYLAWTLGLVNEVHPMPAHSLIEDFDWAKIRKEDWVLPANLSYVLKKI